MRKLLNTLFVTSEDAYLTLDGENVVVNREKQEVARFPLHTLSGIIAFSYAGASPALMGGCAKRGVSLTFYRPVPCQKRRRGERKRPAAPDAVPRGGQSGAELPHCAQYDLRQAL